MLLGLGALACGTEEAAPGGGTPGGLEAGDATLSWDAEGATLTLEHAGAPRVELPLSAFELGRVDALSDEFNYDPWPVALGQVSAEPAGLRWLPAEAGELERTDTGWVLHLVHAEGLPSRVELAVGADGRIDGRFIPEAAGDVAYLRIAPRVATDEAFYGLGEYFDEVNHRGKIRPMQMGLDGSTESGTNEAHYPIPFVIGTRGWGLFVAADRPGAFDVAATAPDRVAATFGTGLASAEGLRFHLLSAPRPMDVTRLYYDLTGYPRLPARWALGPWIWRDENDDQAQVEADIDALRDLDLATSALWIDRPYASGVNSFDFDPVKFPDADAMIAKAHALGLRMALWHTPYLDDSDPDTAALLAEAEQNGYHPPTVGLTATNQWGVPIDFTNPAAYAWWQGLIDRYVQRGIEGFKLDYGEDIVPGVFGARNKWVFADGSDERTMHRGYTLLYHRVYAEALGDDQFLLCRAGRWGDQVNVTVVWPGDLDARMWRHGEEVTEGGSTIVAVGGLHASMVAGLTLGPSGFPFYGADTGGYRHSPPDVETFRRWFEQTAFSSVMQIGTSSNDVAWEFNDPALLDSYREYTRLHLRLFPYEWTYAQQLRETGHPLQRSLGLVHPELGLHPSDVYFFGEHLLVAPVTDAGVTRRDVPLPPGEWVDWWSGARHAGGGTLDYAAPLGTIPVLMRAGAIVPLLRPTIDTLSPTTDTARVDSYATTPGVLHPRVAPGPASTFTLFDGSEVSQADTPDTLTLGWVPGAEFATGASFEVIAWGATPPAAVEADGAPLAQRSSVEELAAAADGWVLVGGAVGGTLHVKVAGAATIAVTR